MPDIEPTTSAVFPVGLLLAGRPCLVVGGGKVAARKVRLLLDALAAVTVVSPSVEADVRDLVAAGRIRHEARPFAAADVDGCRLVFAATNDPAVNRDVIESCHRRGVPVCSVDRQWRDGDFVTPATLRKGSLVISVSTGGRSCRQARLVKANLARHVATVEAADLFVLGTSHEQLSVERREPFHLAGPRLERTGRMLTQVWGVHELLLLNTCNRVELIGLVSRESAASGLLERVLGFDGLEDEGYYRFSAFDAFEHVALLTAGLLSQTPGENHIVAQVKEAVQVAVDRGWASGTLRSCVDAILHVSKDIRAVAGPLLKDFEIEDLCVQYLRAEAGDLSGRCVVVVGTGLVGSGVVARCRTAGMRCLWCYHVNRPEIAPADAGHIELCTLNALRERLGEADLVVTAAAGPGHVLHQGHAPFFDQQKEVLIVDLAMPRNVAPALNGLTPSLRVADLDDLKHWYRRELADLDRIHDLGRRVAREHRDMYDRIMHSLQGGNEE